MKASIVHNSETPHALSAPTDIFNAINLVSILTIAWIKSKTDRASSYVCCRSIYLTFPFPLRLKKATIEPSCPFFATARPSRMLSRVSSSFDSSAFLTMSSPQQCRACFLMLLVDPLSAVSRYRRTIRRSDPFPLQTGAVHMNSWHCRPLTMEILGRGSKNAYIGEFHVWASRSRVVGLNFFDSIEIIYWIH